MWSLVAIFRPLFYNFPIFRHCIFLYFCVSRELNTSIGFQIIITCFIFFYQFASYTHTHRAKHNICCSLYSFIVLFDFYFLKSGILAESGHHWERAKIRVQRSVRIHNFIPGKFRERDTHVPFPFPPNVTKPQFISRWKLVRNNLRKIFFARSLERPKFTVRRKCLKISSRNNTHNSGMRREWFCENCSFFFNGAIF